jgi:hypothetical protein
MYAGVPTIVFKKLLFSEAFANPKSAIFKTSS